jgi:hypothetical protein
VERGFFLWELSLRSVFRHARINLVGPLQDAACEIDEVGEAVQRFELLDSARRALAATSHENDCLVAADAVGVVRHGRQRNQFAAEVAMGVLVRLAYVNEVVFRACVTHSSEFLYGD